MLRPHTNGKQFHVCVFLSLFFAFTQSAVAPPISIFAMKKQENVIFVLQRHYGPATYRVLSCENVMIIEFHFILLLFLIDFF